MTAVGRWVVAADTTAELNRRDLLRELAAWSGRALDPADYPTWRTVFRLLVALASEAPLVVVLDEFQYLLGGPDDAASQLVAVWDREAAGRPLTLVLKRARPTGDEAKKIANELRNWVAKEIGPIAKPKDIRFGDNLPKTRSGKIMRRLLRSIAKGEAITQDTSTLENPAILEQLAQSN